MIAERREKLKAIRQAQAEGKGVAFPNDFKPTDHAAELFAAHAGQTPEGLIEQNATAKVAGRMMLKRVMGKASFATLQDSSGRIQIYIKRDDVGEDVYASFKHWDLGDIVAAEGKIFKTKTGELSIHATEVRLLTKSLRPMPDKFHGMHDQEVKYRQRYVDLMTDETTRARFVARSKAVSGIRDFMVAHDFLEVETPMLHPIPGGANAKPFTTHHNALDQQMFLRIAPELYLKRLIVGGFERVFEINRNFRNEGISVRHNPEFTMMEFYQAYATFEDLMNFTEELLCHVAKEVLGTLDFSYGGAPISFQRPWQRFTVKEAILHFGEIDAKSLEDRDLAYAYAQKIGLALPEEVGYGRLITEIFEEVAESKLIQPTFITAYPTEVSPLSRKSDQDPEIVDRFEFFCAGREMANAFSELNDPRDQKERFLLQVAAKAKGDEEAHYMDEDYIRALEYGLPPTAGEGIGIDRLVMLLTDSPSIRDVILFPQLRKEAK